MGRFVIIRFPSASHIDRSARSAIELFLLGCGLVPSQVGNVNTTIGATSLAASTTPAAFLASPAPQPPPRPFPSFLNGSNMLFLELALRVREHKRDGFADCVSGIGEAQRPP